MTWLRAGQAEGMPENSQTHPLPCFGGLIPRDPTHRVEGEERLLGGLQEGTQDVDGGFEGGSGSSVPHGHHRLVGHPHAQLQRQRAGEDLGDLHGAGGGQGNGGEVLCVARVGARRRWLTWGMSGRRADVDSEMLSGTCRNGTSGVSDQEGLCKAPAGLGWTPPTNTSTR